MARTRKWFRFTTATGEIADYRLEGGPFLVQFPPAIGQSVTILRTRLMAQAWWGSNDFAQPSLAAQHFPLRAMVAYNFAESGSYPPPVDWPSPDGSGVGHNQPTINDPLTLTMLTYKPADPVAVTPQVWHQAAQLLTPAGDSQGQRRFDGTYVATAWAQISQHDEGSSPGPAPFAFYGSMWLDVLAESGV